MDAGKAINELREIRGIKHKELAELCGYSHGAISKIENEKEIVSTTKFKKIAESLGIPFAHLLLLMLDDEDLPSNCLNRYKLIRKEILNEYRENLNRKKVTRCFQCKLFKTCSNPNKKRFKRSCENFK